MNEQESLALLEQAWEDDRCAARRQDTLLPCSGLQGR